MPAKQKLIRNYSKERHKLIAKQSVRQLAEEIKRRRKRQ